MLLTSVILFAVGVTSWTVPKGQSEGVYSVHVDDAGIEKHTLIKLQNASDSTPTARDLVASAKFAGARAANKRQIGGGTNLIECGGYEMNHYDTDGAVYALDAQCTVGTTVGGDLDFYSIVGCVVCYFCNYYSGSDVCFASERQRVTSAITDRCGSYWAGWDYFTSDFRHNQYGYEYFCNQGANFCAGRGTNGR
ncbi:hypothetical protein MMC30_002631 [Trapelia coarctata]|nr:hypothetical protein [Trapelia coarctata]